MQKGLGIFVGAPCFVLASFHGLTRNSGTNRLVHGRNSFAMAETVVREHGWTFSWQKAEVPGIGHSTTKMFKSSQAYEAVQD